MIWLWAKFDEKGITFDGGTDDTGPIEYKYKGPLNLSAMSANTANFQDASGPQGTIQGSIKFEIEDSKIANITVSFTSGTSYNNQDIKCMFVKN